MEHKATCGIEKVTLESQIEQASIIVEELVCLNELLLAIKEKLTGVQVEDIEEVIHEPAANGMLEFLSNRNRASRIELTQAASLAKAIDDSL